MLEFLSVVKFFGEDDLRGPLISLWREFDIGFDPITELLLLSEF
jgi:hypothetical protein